MLAGKALIFNCGSFRVKLSLSTYLSKPSHTHIDISISLNRLFLSYNEF